MTGRPNVEEVPEESLETRMAQLAEMKAEYQTAKKEFKNKHKHLLESIKSLENIVIAEVMQGGKTVTVGNIKAEIITTVKIRMKKENNDGE